MYAIKTLPKVLMFGFQVKLGGDLYLTSVTSVVFFFDEKGNKKVLTVLVALLYLVSMS